MLVIGLTGGIGSGKTAVSDHFSTLGVPIIDTDLISRQLVEPGQPLLQRIVETFGDQYLGSDGQLNRPALRQLIFSKPEARQQLEALLHPAIRDETQRQLRQTQADYAMVVIPLLTENSADYALDRVLVVDAPESLQIRRVMRRDNISETAAKLILDSQASKTQRLGIADDVIANDSDLATLHTAVDELHSKYLQLAQDFR